MFKTARYFAYNKHKLRFYCHKIFISFTFHERAFSNHGFYNDTTVYIYIYIQESFKKAAYSAQPGKGALIDQ